MVYYSLVDEGFLSNTYFFYKLEGTNIISLASLLCKNGGLFKLKNRIFVSVSTLSVLGSNVQNLIRFALKDESLIVKETEIEFDKAKKLGLRVTVTGALMSGYMKDRLKLIPICILVGFMVHVLNWLSWFITA